MQYKRNCSRSRKKFLLDMGEDIDLAKVLTVSAVNLNLNKCPRKERELLQSF